MSNENKLSPVTVYVPVSVKDDSPKENESVFVFTEGYGGNIVAEYKNFEYIDPNLLEEGTGRPVDATEFVTHFLKEQSKYVFSREELEGLLGKAMDKMENRVDYENNKDGWETVPPSKDEIIQSLF